MRVDDWPESEQKLGGACLIVRKMDGHPSPERDLSTILSVRPQREKTEMSKESRLGKEWGALGCAEPQRGTFDRHVIFEGQGIHNQNNLKYLLSCSMTEHPTHTHTLSLSLSLSPMEY